jgi:hypothetical protein
VIVGKTGPELVKSHYYYEYALTGSGPGPLKESRHMWDPQCQERLKVLAILLSIEQELARKVDFF